MANSSMTLASMASNARPNSCRYAVMATSTNSQALGARAAAGTDSLRAEHQHPAGAAQMNTR